MKRLPVVRIVEGHEVRRCIDGSRAPREYILIGGRRVWLHHYLAEKHIRPLRPGELVHHADGDPLNNSVENLVIVTRAEHVCLHKPALGYRFTEEQRRQLSEAHEGQQPWNKGSRGHKHTTEARANMSRAQRGRKITWGKKISEAKRRISLEAAVALIASRESTTLRDLREAFGLKSNMAITALGGVKHLRAVAKKVQ